MDRRGRLRSREVFQTHPVLYKRGEDIFVRTWGRSDNAKNFALEIPPVRDFFDYRYWCGHSPSSTGYYDASAELGRFVVIGVSCCDRWERVVGDWDSPEGEVWWEVDPLLRIR